MWKTLSILILCQLPLFSGNCQNITVSDKYISFDSVAAKKLLITLYDLKDCNAEKGLLHEIIASYDSAYLNQQEIIKSNKLQINRQDQIIAEKERTIKVNDSEIKKLRWYLRGSAVLILLFAIL